MALDGSLIGQFVLVLLLLMSSMSWAVIILKWLQIRRINHENPLFLETFHKYSVLDHVYKNSANFQDSPVASMFHQTYIDTRQLLEKCLKQQQGTGPSEMLPQMDSHIQRVIEQSFNQEYGKIEERLNILATVSSTAPFVGLFGTVLGIIDSFQNIGTSGATSLASVAPGISEALIATAAGLLAAIPALIAYNYYRNRIRSIGNTMRDFGMELTNRMEWSVHERLLATR